MLAAGRNAGRRHRPIRRAEHYRDACRVHSDSGRDLIGFARRAWNRLRKIAVADYWLHYKLMQATGIEKELGGEAQAIEALKALGDAYERRMRVAQDEMPKMIPTTFTGEGMNSGFMGMGMGGSLGMIAGGMRSGGERHVRCGAQGFGRQGPIKRKKVGLEGAQVGEDGSLSQSLEFEVNEDGINGKVKMNTKMDACPDADGRVTVGSTSTRR